MLTIDKLDVTSYNINQLTLTWTFKDTIESLSDFTMDVYRSETPGVSGVEDYDHIASGLAASGYSYTDTGVSGLYDPLRTWYYKIKLTDTSKLTTSIQPTKPSYRKGNPTEKFTVDIIRRKSLVLNRHSGRDFYILKRRTYGTHCPICWDTILMRIRTSECGTCYGTGWVEGYFKPIPIKGMLSPSPKYNQITMFGEWYPLDNLLLMLNYPPVRAKDILIDDKNQRWVARQVKTIEKNGFLIEQNVRCSLIALDDKIYEVPVT